MSLELIREDVKVNQVIGEDSVQTIMDNDIIVPDVKPDIARVLLLDGEAVVMGAETGSDRIQVTGTLKFKILYVSDDPTDTVKCIQTSSGFSYPVEMANVKAGMKAKVACEIEHMDHDILNGRKLNVKTILKLNCKVSSEMEMGVINGLKGIDDLQVLNNSAAIHCFIGSSEADCNISDKVEVPAGKPAIREILRSDVKITGKDYKLTENRIIARGDLNVCTLYIADDEDRSIQSMEHEIPFTQFVELQGLDENAACDLDLLIGETQFEPVEDADGELRLLDVQVEIKIQAEATYKRSLELIEDAYSPNMRLGFERESFAVDEMKAESQNQIVLKDTLVMQEENPEIAQIFNVLCKPVMTDYKVYDEKVVLEGMVNCSVLYLVNNVEQPVFCSQDTIPFRQTIDIKGIRAEMGCNVALDIEHYNYSLVTAREVEIRLVIAADIKVVNKQVIPLITKVNEFPVDEKKLASQPSILIYFAQPGDTLWKVAKKYYTTMEEVKQVNEMPEGAGIVPGQQIFIPRRKRI